MVTFLRAFRFAALPLALVAISTNTSAQQSQPRPRAAQAVVEPEPEIRTRIESLLWSPAVFLSTDYYRIEMRFGPPVRLDAVIVTAVESRARMTGLRIQVRDEDRTRQRENAAYLDLDEVEKFSRALALMDEMASQWTNREDRRAAELSFTSAGGLRLSTYQSGHPSGRVQKAYLSTGFTDPVTTSFELNELASLKQAVDQALALLKGR